MARIIKRDFRRRLLASVALAAGGLWAADAVRAADAAMRLAQAAQGSTQQQPAQGAQPQRGASGQQGTAQTQASRDVRASQFIGMEVKDAQGETLGQVNDLIIDPTGQTVHYAVLGFGGFLGLGERLFAYPVQAFRFGLEADTLVLNVPRERLRDAPGFERNRWPDWGRRDEPYRAEVDRYHGAQGQGTARPGGTTAQTATVGQPLLRVSELLGQNVDDQRGARAGQIEDLVVNLDTARVRYAVLEMDRGWGGDERLVPLSLNAFLFPADRDRNPVLNATRERLDTSASFQGNRWPDVNDPAYRGTVDRSLGASRGVAGRPGDDEGTRSR